jgi:hypothetical protein
MHANPMPIFSILLPDDPRNHESQHNRSLQRGIVGPEQEGYCKKDTQRQTVHALRGRFKQPCHDGDR